MPKRKPSPTHVPSAWVDVVRHHWHRRHTVQVSYRTSPNVPWQHCYEQAIPDHVEKTDGEVVKIDAAAAADVARDCWDQAWDHLDELDETVKRCDYKIGAYGLDKDNNLTLLGETGVGGRLPRDRSSIEDAPGASGDDQEKSLVGTLMRERKDMFAESIRMVRAQAAVSEKLADVLEKCGELIQKAGDGSAREAEAYSEARRAEAKFETVTQIGQAWIDKKAPIWKAEAEAKRRKEAGEHDAKLDTLCRHAAASVDAPTAMRWEESGMDWRAVVGVLHTAGEHPDWEHRVKTVMQQLAENTEIWKLASATCTAAFQRVAEKVGVTLG